MLKYSITYDVVTSESCEHGDTSESGWYLPGGWKFPLKDEDGHHADTLKDAQNGEFDLTGTLSELLDLARQLGINSFEGAEWFYSADPEENYTTGENTSYCLHLDDSSMRHFDRVARFI